MTIRETVVVGVVGAGGLGVLLQTQLVLFDYGGAVTTIATALVRSTSSVSSGPPENRASTSSLPSGSAPSTTSAILSSFAVALTYPER